MSEDMACQVELTSKEIIRYSRQIRLSEIGIEGQEKIKNASVLVVGAGALGCPVLQYLTSAGVGTIGIVDNDLIDETNLHRQILYDFNDIEKPKPLAAREKLNNLNAGVKINVHFIRLVKENALQLLRQYDIIVDCTDNFGSRYLINDAAVLLNKPVVYGAIHRFSGQVMVLNYKYGPTLRCISPDPPHPIEAPGCDDIGVIGPVAGIIGSMQAMEVLKIILEFEGILTGKMYFLDTLSYVSQLFTFQRDPIKADVEVLSEYPETGCSDEDQINELSVSDFLDLKRVYPDLKVIDLRDEENKSNIGLETIDIPFRELYMKLGLIPFDGPKVFYCSYGISSSMLINYLNKVKNMDNLYRLNPSIEK